MIVENIVRWQNFLRRRAFMGEDVPWFKVETMTHSLADELLIRQQVQEAFMEYNNDALALSRLKQRKKHREWRQTGRMTRQETRAATARARRASFSPTKSANRGKGGKLSPREREELQQRKFDIGERNEETGSVHYSDASDVQTSPGGTPTLVCTSPWKNLPGGSLPPATVEPPEPLPTSSTGQEVIPPHYSDVSETDSIDRSNATCEYEYDDEDDDEEDEGDEDDTDQVMDNLDNDRDRTIDLRGDAPGTPLQDEHESP
jgi:hypothetical protein